MPQPIENQSTKKTSPMASKTTPQLINMYRRIMLLDEIITARELRYEQSLKSWKNDIKNPPKGLNTIDPDAYLRKKHRQFYAHEMSVVANYEADTKRFENLVQSDLTFAEHYKESTSLPEDKRAEYIERHEAAFFANISPEDIAEYKKLKQEMSMGVDTRIRASYFTPEFINNSPDYALAREKVRGMIRASVPAGMKGTKGEHTGVINLFNQKYKGLKEQLNGLAQKYPNEVKVAKALLKTGAVTMNPSGYLIGRGVSVIMQTKAFNSLSEKISKQVERVAEKTGLKQAIVAKLQSPKGELYKKFALGAVSAVSTALLVSSIIDSEQAGIIFTGAQDMLADAYSAGMEGFDKGLEITSNGLSEAKDVIGRGVSDALDYAEDTFTVENGTAVVESLKETGAEALDDINQKFNMELPDFGFSQTSEDLIESDKPEIVDNSIKPDVSVDAIEEPEALNLVRDGVESVAPEVEPVAPEVESVMPEVESVAPEVEVEALELETLVEDAVQPPSLLAESTYEVQPGDTPSEIAELRLKEAGIPYDYNKIMKVVHMMADANDGMTNINYIQAGWDLKLPALDASLVDNYTIPELKVDVSIDNDIDLTLPPTVEFSGFQATTEMSVSEEIESRFELANMAYSVEDIDSLTKEILFVNGITGELPKNGVLLDMKVIDDIVAYHAVDKPSLPDVKLKDVLEPEPQVKELANNPAPHYPKSLSQIGRR